MDRYIITIVLLLLPLHLFAVEVQLTYQDNSDNELGFNLERSTDGETWTVVQTVGVDVTTIVDNVDQGTYFYRVNAFNEFGYSGYTNVVEFTTQQPPDSPEQLGVQQKKSLEIITNQDGSITVRPAQ